MIKNHFKIAWRNLLRHRRMTLINVAGLGIGMAATILIVLWVQNELSFDKDQPDAINIYRIKTKLAISPHENWLWEGAPYALGEHAQREIPEIETLTRLSPSNYSDVNIHYKDEIISEKNAAYVDNQWFNVFHYDFVEGSTDEFNKTPFSLILTQSAAKKYFGNREAVGEIMRIDSNNYQVRAIVKDNPANSSFQYNVLIPIAAQLSNADAKKNALVWGNFNYLTFVKLKPNTDKKKVSTELFNILHRNRDKDDGKASFSLVNIKDMHFENDLMNSSFLHGNHTIVNVFIALASLLLITACINYVNLTTARASIRSKEVSVRKIVGAGRLQLFGQFMSESLLVSLLAIALSLALVQLAMPWYQDFTGKHFINPISSLLVWEIVGVTLLISFVLNGLYPALLLSSFSPLNVFRGKSMLNFKDSWLRKSLVIVQFTISVILIIGTLVIYRQLNYIENTDLGYNRAHIFTINMPWKAMGKNPWKDGPAILNSIKQEMKQQSSIAEVSLAQGQLVNFSNGSSGSFDWNGRPKDFDPEFAPLEADQDFQHLMNIGIKEGRWFNGGKADLHNVLLNETAVKLIHLPKPVIGQRFIHQGDTGVIIGVVKDFHYKSLHEKIGAMIIANSGITGTIYIKTTPGNAKKAIAAVQKIMEKFAPNDPLEYHFLDETYDNLYHSEQQSSVLIALFAGIAILVSALGLLGLAAFAAEQKVKEIGIRKVLGASVQHIVSLLSVDFLKMVVIASIIAFPIAWWAMNKWLQDFAYRISLSWWIFLLAACIALVIALITVSMQAIKAAMANPVKSLRSE
ncbi:ABC transporter permease [Mucilaginibacter sp. McL0603]|uniref:ABC transporter permease n=1 Tax=Mucilaginibacter sp. McL0603 TaxID=3415670 RepID=UPI003CF643C4